MLYEIQHRIETLSENAVAIMALDHPASFELQNIRFSHWNFSFSDGWKDHCWLATSSIHASSLYEAYSKFNGALAQIVPRISLIGQCYTQHLNQPFLIHRTDSEIAFVRYISEAKGVGLMFQDKELEGLTTLLTHPEVPDEFYYYWNDAVNSIGYSPKLLLMFSAIEALVKIQSGKDKGKKDWNKLEIILGSELKTILFGTKKNPSSGLRHRLVHGEYFSSDDSEQDYSLLVHQKVVTYFNQHVFKKNVINEGVIRPQRHIWGNKREARVFIKSKSGHPVTIKAFLSEVEETGLNQLKNYEYVSDEDLTKHY